MKIFDQKNISNAATDALLSKLILDWPALYRFSEDELLVEGVYASTRTPDGVRGRKKVEWHKPLDFFNHVLSSAYALTVAFEKGQGADDILMVPAFAREYFLKEMDYFFAFDGVNIIGPSERFRTGSPRESEMAEGSFTKRSTSEFLRDTVFVEKSYELFLKSLSIVSANRILSGLDVSTQQSILVDLGEQICLPAQNMVNKGARLVKPVATFLFKVTGRDPRVVAFDAETAKFLFHPEIFRELVHHAYLYLDARRNDIAYDKNFPWDILQDLGSEIDGRYARGMSRPSKGTLKQLYEIVSIKPNYRADLDPDRSLVAQWLFEGLTGKRKISSYPRNIEAEEELFLEFDEHAILEQLASISNVALSINNGSYIDAIDVSPFDAGPSCLSVTSVVKNGSTVPRTNVFDKSEACHVRFIVLSGKNKNQTDSAELDQALRASAVVKVLEKVANEANPMRSVLISDGLPFGDEVFQKLSSGRVRSFELPSRYTLSELNSMLEDVVFKVSASASSMAPMSGAKGPSGRGPSGGSMGI